MSQIVFPSQKLGGGTTVLTRADGGREARLAIRVALGISSNP